MRLLVAAVCAVSIALLNPHSAAANPQKKRVALVLLKKGVQLYQAGDYDGALALFNSAYASYASHKILLNIGTAYKALGRSVEAANTYDKYLRTKGLKRRRVREVRKLLRALDATLAKLRLDGGESGAEVFVDTKPFGAYKPSMLVRVVPGQHEVTLRLGDREAKQTVAVGAGQRVTVTLVLSAKAVKVVPPPPPKPTPVAPPVPDTTKKSPVPPPSPAKPVRVAAATEPAAAEGGGASATVHSAAPAVKSHRFSGMVYADLDYKARGAAVFAGLGMSLSSLIEVSAAALVGAEGQGLYAGATARFGAGAIKPQVSAGIPVFFSDGARIAVRATGGAAWSATSRISLVVELGVEHYFSPEENYKQTILLPAIGVKAGL